MDYTLYNKYLQEYIDTAIGESDGSNRGIAEALSIIRVRGLLVMHKEERQRALNDARRAFDEYRHWPLEIILSQLGVERRGAGSS